MNPDLLNLKAIKRENGNPFFPALKIGTFEVSIQASSGHYCSPKTNLPTLGDYKSVEVCIFEGDKTIYPFEDSRFEVWPWSKEFESSGYGARGWVTWDELAEILDVITTQALLQMYFAEAPFN